MSTNFIVSGLASNNVMHLFEMSEENLHKINAASRIVDNKPGYPCRVSLEDAELGERVILFPFVHHPVQSPYYSAGPVFVRENAKPATLLVNEIPRMFETRLLSIRAYNAAGEMICAEVIEGY